MEIDHIFVFSNKAGKEADVLVAFGLTEGSSRLHPGQGTTNRKFYFQNFFLEVLWVVDEGEIRSELTANTKLWERSQFHHNGNSRFGLCLVNSASTDNLFQGSQAYQPDYFPKGMSIDIITNEHAPNLPWTFRLPYRGERKGTVEPMEHSNQIKKLTRTVFEIPRSLGQNEFQRYFQDSGDIVLHLANRTHVTLEFDHVQQGKSQEFPALDMTIKY